jgi:hypothetical protein
MPEPVDKLQGVPSVYLEPLNFSCLTHRSQSYRGREADIVHRISLGSIDSCLSGFEETLAGISQAESH